LYKEIEDALLLNQLKVRLPSPYFENPSDRDIRIFFNLDIIKISYRNIFSKGNISIDGKKEENYKK
jgi:hypothetical protein